MAFDKKQYDEQYQKENVKRKFIAFNLKDPEDQELLSYLQGIENINRYVKGLIRKDMEDKREI